MKIIRTAENKIIMRMSKNEWNEIGKTQGWIIEAKKKIEKSPKEHGFIDQCIKENKKKDNPGACCASIVDKVKGTTTWRKGPKKKD